MRTYADLETHFYRSIFGFAVFFLIVGTIGVLVYSKCGWKRAKTYFVISDILPFITIIPMVSFDYSLESAAHIAIGIYITIQAIFMLIVRLRIHNNEADYNAYLDKKVLEAGAPSDEELLQIKRTMGFNRNDPDYDKMNGYLEREELTRRWTADKRKEFDDPIAWLFHRD